MARSGSFNTNSVAWTYVTFNWSVVSQDIQNNRTTISWNVSLNQDAGLSISAEYFYLDIDGSRQLSVTNKTIKVGEFGSGTLTFDHNADGNRSFTVSMSGYGTFVLVGGEISGTQTFAIDTIPRASTISSATNVTLGNACSVGWTPAVANYKYKIAFTFGSWSYTTDFILPGTTGAYNYTGYVIPLEAARQIPNATTGTMTATLYTYNSGGTQIGSASSKTFTVTVPATLTPTAAMAVSSINTLSYYSLEDIFIQGRSKANVSFAGSAGQYGAGIASCSYVLLGKTYSVNSAGSIMSGYITSSGAVEIKGTVKDTRGYTTSISKTINVYAYSAPSVIPYSGNTIIVQRENETQLRIAAGKKFSSLGGNNLCSLAYRYAKSGDSLPSGWTELLSEESSSDKVNIIAAGVTLNRENSYTVELKAEDALGEQGIFSFTISTEEITFHLKNGGKGAAFGKYSEEEDLLDVAWDAAFRKGINGVYFKTANLSTTTCSITMTGTKQNVFIIGSGFFGVLNYNGTSTTWVGNGNVSCSTNGKAVSVTVPAAGTLVAISDYPFDIK